MPRLAAIGLPAPIGEQIIVEFIDLFAETHLRDACEEQVRFLTSWRRGVFVDRLIGWVGKIGLLRIACFEYEIVIQKAGDRITTGLYEKMVEKSDTPLCFDHASKKALAHLVDRALANRRPHLLQSANGPGCLNGIRTDSDF